LFPDELLGLVSPPIFDSRGRALRRLASGTVPQDELPSLIESIVSNVKPTDIVELLPESDAQMFIDVIDEVRDALLHIRGVTLIVNLPSVQAVDNLDFAPQIRNKCVRSLYKMCAGHTMLPRSLHFELPGNAMDADGALYCGGYADVFRCESGGREVAVKVLRRLSLSSQEIKKVSRR
jgi:hypothetical protein